MIGKLGVMFTPADRVDEILSFLRQNEVGRRARIATPFGSRLISYADLTASGRFLHFIEAWIRRVRPFYANTHTAVSSTGRILTELREEARGIIAESLGAGPEHEAIFCGSGATAAINKLVGLFGLRISEPLERRFNLSAHIPEEARPIVFVGPYEHHSNYLPWLESIARVVEVPAMDDGSVDLAFLERGLTEHATRELKIGAFSAASNVTGVLADVPAITALLHAHGAKAVFDYAAAAPYVPIDMTPDGGEPIDALVVSPHKFLGGPGGSGILVAHRDLFLTRTPERPGGGTVSYVGAVDFEAVDYVERLDEREEGGTPAILCDLRAGTAFLVKRMVGEQHILEHEKQLAASSVARLVANPKITVLGPTDGDRLAIISIIFEDLHHDFASGLLDQLFGVQSRSGCACAGPYGHRLLKIDERTSTRYRHVTARGILGMKPGWVRLSLPYYASAEDIEFILRAVEFVAEHGHEFLSSYRFSWRTGVWTHLDRQSAANRPLELTIASLEEAAMSFGAGDHELPLSNEAIEAERADYFVEAERLLATARARNAAAPPVYNPGSGDDEVDELVWFRYVRTTDMAAAAQETLHTTAR